MSFREDPILAKLLVRCDLYCGHGSLNPPSHFIQLELFTYQRATTISSDQVPDQYSCIFESRNDASVGLRNRQ